MKLDNMRNIAAAAFIVTGIQCVLNMLEKIRRWFELHVIFRRAVPFTYGLIFVNAWVEYALVAILIVHLTDNRLSLPKAASVMNIQDGVTAFLFLVVAYASDAHLGPFWTVVCTTISYIAGLLLLFLAAWRLQSIETILIYMAVIFVAFGRAGRDIALKEFLADQFQFRKDGSLLNEEQMETRRKVWWRSAYMLGICASVFVFANASWIQLSGISTIAMVVALGLFFGGIKVYKRKKPSKSNSSLYKMWQVLHAAILKRHIEHTTINNEDLIDIPKLRWLDKAAIQESSISLEEQKERGRLCTVEQVQEVKILLTLVPLWTTFLTYGLLQATGNTFFYEQVNYTDTHLGRISAVPVVIYVIVKSSTSFIVSRICDKIFPSHWSEKKHIMLGRVGAGMTLGPVCCLVAWRIENYRLEQYVNRDISISFLWLIPQFFLLGFMEGLVSDGMEQFFGVHAPESFNKYGPSFTQFALNIGNFVSLAFIFVFHGLFADTLDSSSLGTYYAMLGCICFVNLLFYCFVATYYTKEDPYAPKLEQQPEEEMAEQLQEEMVEQIQSLGDT